MTDNRDTLKGYLIDYIRAVTTKSKNKDQFVCPFCNSGTGKNGTGAFTYYPDTNSYHCFSCGENGDIFTLHAKLNGLSLENDFPQIIDELEKRFNLPSSHESKPKSTPKNYTKLFWIAQQHLHETDYLTKRGISPEIQQKFGCGYMAGYQYDHNTKATPAVIIPTSDSSYMWRSTTENVKQKRGQAHILNPNALKNDYCFVVEGEIDCISVVECGFSCIGLGSTSNVNKIFDYKPLNTMLIIAMDNDIAGVKATRQLESLCIQQQVPYIIADGDIWGNFKDANELLIADRQQLTTNLDKLMKQAVSLDKAEWLEQIQKRLQGDIDWQDTLQRNATNNQLKNSLQNLEIIFMNDETYKDKIEFNELSQTMTFNRQDWRDVIENRMKLYLEKKYSLYTSIESITQICSIIADEHRYHPIQDYLNSLTWDGVPRIKTVFSDFLGATNSKYTQAVAVVTFVGAVARIFQAGVKYDTCTVFVGKQGTGKSKFISKIAHNPDWFTDGVTTFDGKEFYESILAKWIIELGEGTAFQKSVKERCKQAIASQQDYYRKPYGRNPEVRKRQCIFLGTTNNYDFLKDETGDRRYYPIDVNIFNATKSIDKDLTDEYVGQLWAEAVIMLRNGESIYIQDNEVINSKE